MAPNNNDFTNDGEKPTKTIDASDSSFDTASMTSVSTNSMSSQDFDSSMEEDSFDMVYKERPLVLRLPMQKDKYFIGRSTTENFISWAKKFQYPKPIFALLLSFSIATMLVRYSALVVTPQVVAVTASQAKLFHHFLQQEAPRLRKKMVRKHPGDDFTILLSGSRVDLMQQSLDAHSRCSSVKEIQIDWQSDGEVPEILVYHEGGKANAKESFTTQAVFLLDEDIILSCDDLERAFHTWKTDPSRQVGFFPHRYNPISESQDEKNMDTSDGKQTLKANGYSLMSNRASFVHRMYLNSLPTYSKSPCDHLMLSLQISMVSSKAPIAVSGNPHTLLEGINDNNIQRLLQGNNNAPSNEIDECVSQWTKSLNMEQLPQEVMIYFGSR